jgi:hypothetical protein
MPRPLRSGRHIPAATATTGVPLSFAASVATVAAADLIHIWRPGCRVDPGQLRLIRMRYWGFDGRPRTGRVVVNAVVFNSVIAFCGEVAGRDRRTISTSR